MEQSRVTHERDSLNRVREVLSQPGMGDQFSRMGQAFLDAQLDGQYPDTRLVVRVRDKREDVIRTHAYCLWGEVLGREETGRDPYAVANFIAVALQEPGGPGPDEEVTVARIDR